jgi:DNA-binding HxlR family transcriptional regulator
MNASNEDESVIPQNSPWNPYLKACPTRQLLDRIGDQWTVLVIGALAAGPLRYTDLERRIDGISEKMLTQTVRALERDGFVTRTVQPVVPPHVEYQLTDLGRSLQAPIASLASWATGHMSEVLAAREEYDHPKDAPDTAVPDLP